MGFNMQNPIVGTGLGTPAGHANPANAAMAAQHVRQAISYLIPRDLVVKQLLSGAGVPGTTALRAFGSGFQDPSVTEDPYDPNLAKGELAAAGYQTGVNPITPITPAPAVAADFLYGQAVPVEGTFKNPLTQQPYVNFVVNIQESQDNKTWIDSGYAPLTDGSGNYHAMIVPNWSTTYFRPYFTGYVVPTSVSGKWPILANTTYTDLVAAGKIQQILPPVIGPVQTFTTHTLQDILTNTLKPYATADSVTALTTTVATKTDVSTLTNQVTALNSSINNLTNYLYASIAIAVIAILIAAFAVMRKK
jgi:ABC-type transport system substrate-binding protein